MTVLNATLGLRKEGDEISAYIKIPGAILAATGDSVKDALTMLAESLDENDEPFWAFGEAHHDSTDGGQGPGVNTLGRRHVEEKIEDTE